MSHSFIWILAASAFASTFSGRAVEPMVGVMARDLGTTVETTALLSAAFTLPYALIQPILGPVGDAVGKERVMKICLAVLVAALLASVVATDAPMLFALRILAGAAAGGVIPLALALVGDRVDMASRQVAISRFIAAAIVGQLAGSSLAGILAEFIGWRGVFGVTTAMMVAALIATVLGFRDAPAGSAFDLGKAVERYRVILRNSRAQTLFALVFVEALAVFGLFPYIAPLLESRGEGGAAEAGLVLAGFAVGGLLYSALLSWMLRVLGLRWMLVAGGVVAGSANLSLGLAGDWRLDAAAMVALGLGFYMLHNSFQTQVTEIAPEARASAVAIHAFAFFVGQALGVVILGIGLRTAGLLPTMALAAAVILGVGLAAAAALTGPTQRPR
ncbi:MAG TPA: MFS transporter [Microvirga sp.]|jgi:predicted MFS family arabinose efflux permease|nr:MFS transporter [Microvirga sp.]